MAIKRRKLYFLADFTNATATLRVFPCTQFKQSYTGDIYGGVLEDFAPLTVGSLGETKRRNDAAAWVRALSSRVSTNFVAAFDVVFCAATTVATSSAATILQTASIKTAAGSTLGVDGVTPILTRHFGVRVQRKGTAAATGKVMVYVQRQHSIEV